MTLYIAFQLNSGMYFIIYFIGRSGNSMKSKLFGSVVVMACVFVLVCALSCSCNAGSSNSGTSSTSLSKSSEGDGAVKRAGVSLSEQPASVVSQKSNPLGTLDITEWRNLMASVRIALEEFKSPDTK
jgi:hypothetical protein